MTDSQVIFQDLFESRFGVRIENLIHRKTTVFVDNKRPYVAVRNDGNDDIIVYHNIKEHELEQLKKGNEILVFSRVTIIYAHTGMANIVDAMKQSRLFEVQS